MKSESHGPADKFECPTSAVILKAVVDALVLADGSASAAAKFIGSGDKARNARRVFSPDLDKLVPPKAREQIEEELVKAFIASGVVDRNILAILSGAQNENGLQKMLKSSLDAWTQHWDREIHETCNGWPHLPAHLAGFVVGRIVVIDMAIRLAAVILLGDGLQSQQEIARRLATNWDGVLEAAISEVRGDSQDDKAKKLKTAPRTLQRWLSGKNLPDIDNLKNIAAGVHEIDGIDEKNLLQSLRLWRARQRLKAILKPVIGETFCSELFCGLQRLTLEMFGLLSDMSANPAKWDCNANGIRNALIEMAKQGLGFPPARQLLFMLFGRLQTNESLSHWPGELLALFQQAPADRLDAAFSSIGNWPQFVQNIETGLARGALAAVPSPEHYALQLIDPRFAPATDSAERQSASRASSGGDSLSPLDTGNRKARAIDLMRSSRFEEAAHFLIADLSANPNDAEEHTYLGICYRKLMNSGAALDCFDRAIQLRGDSEEPWVQIGQVWLDRGIPSQAAHELGKAPLSVRNHPEYQRQLGIILLKVERFEESLNAFLKATGLNPDDGGSWNGAAECAFQLGHTAEGRDYARKAHHLGFPDSYQKWCVEQP
jgi:Flp pilus assembly protein TadD